MTNFLAFVVFLSMSGCIMAQPGALRDARKHIESGNFEEARQAIEEAKIHPKTKKEAKTWYLSFVIYEAMYKLEKDPMSKLSHCEAMLQSFTGMSGLEREGEYIGLLSGKIDTLNTEVNSLLEQNPSPERRTVLLKHKMKLSRILGRDGSGLYFDLAGSFKDNNQPDSALKYYDKSIELSFKLYESLQAKLDILSNQARYEEFVDVLDIAAGLYPDDESIALAEVYYLIDKQLYIKARSLLSSYLNFQKNSGKGYLLLGYVYDQLHLTEESVEAYLQALDLGESSFEAYFSIGRHFYQRGKLFMDDGLQMKAKEYFEKAESIEPNNEQLLDTMERFYLDLRDIQNYQRIRAKKNN